MASKKKLVTSAVALGVAAAIGLGGTFAWQSINQTALNEASDIVNPGGRLHNDQWFVDSKTNNNDIYVENFTDDENGEEIFARVRLSEYMEIVLNYGTAGEKVVTVAGSKTPVDGANEDEDDKVYTADSATAKNKFTYTYDVLDFAERMSADEDEESPAKYWNYYTGGATYYMPTFNKNKDSLVADLNGQYVDTLGGISNRGSDRYTDWTEWDADSEAMNANAIYDADSNDADELSGLTYAELAAIIKDGTGAQAYVDANNIRLVDEEHSVQETAEASLISMEEWFDLTADGYDAENHGDYWVYDDSEDGDGWIYWSAPIKPGTATGLLVDAIELKEVMNDTWYYALQATAQFITADDLGTPGDEDGTGFYRDGETVSDAAKDFLEEIGVEVGEDADDDDDDDADLDTEIIITAGDTAETVSYDIEPGYYELTLKNFGDTVTCTLSDEAEYVDLATDTDEDSNDYWYISMSTYEPAESFTITATDEDGTTGTVTIVPKKTTPRHDVMFTSYSLVNGNPSPATYRELYDKQEYASETDSDYLAFATIPHSEKQVTLTWTIKDKDGTTLSDPDTDKVYFVKDGSNLSTVVSTASDNRVQFHCGADITEDEKYTLHIEASEEVWDGYGTSKVQSWDFILRFGGADDNNNADNDEGTLLANITVTKEDDVSPLDYGHLLWANETYHYSATTIADGSDWDLDAEHEEIEGYMYAGFMVLVNGELMRDSAPPSEGVMENKFSTGASRPVMTIQLVWIGVRDVDDDVADYDIYAASDMYYTFDEETHTFLEMEEHDGETWYLCTDTVHDNEICAFQEGIVNTTFLRTGVTSTENIDWSNCANWEPCSYTSE